MFLHKHLARPATALIVAAVGVALFAPPATSLGTGSAAGVGIERQTGPIEASSSGKLLFIENAGQWREAARFQIWGSPLGAGTTWLAEDAIWLVAASGTKSRSAAEWSGGSEVIANRLTDLQPADLHSAALRDLVQPATRHALKLTFLSSNPDVYIEPFEALTTTVSYFIGSDPDKWRPSVPVWGGVRYVDLYPGVDLVMGGRDGGWRLEAASGAAVEDVRMQVEGAVLMALHGASLQLDVAGDPLFVTLPSAPFAYQAVGLSGQGEPLKLTVHRGQRISETVHPDDDPTDLLYSTFLGGGDNDSGAAIAVYGTGSAYVTGRTNSSDFPTTPGTLDPSFNGGFVDTFVVKLNPAGSNLAYATFLGGHDADWGDAIAVDAAGSAYVTGQTDSSNFPTTPGAFDPSFNGFGDAFVVKLNPSGSELAYATFLGGNGYDIGEDVAVDAAGSAYVTGQTYSSDFPTTPGAFDPSFNGFGDAFVVKLNPSGSDLLYGAFLGGSSYDYGSAIAVDEAGSAYVTGETDSSDFPTTPGAFDPSLNGGRYRGDAFVVKLNPAGSELAYATFLGGHDVDWGYGIFVDGAGSAYVTGETLSSNFPTTPGAFDPSFNYSWDVFVVKLNPAGSWLVYATIVGGIGADAGYGIFVDGMGSAYVTGKTGSSDFPTTPGAFDTSCNGGDWGQDAFVIKLNPAGSGLIYATFLGGSDDDGSSGIAVDGTGSVYTTGSTHSSNFPTTPGAFCTSFSSGDPRYRLEAFVVKLDMAPYVPHVIASIEQPSAGAFITGTVILSGYAIDLHSSSGTGIDRVHIYLDGAYGTGTFLGEATYGLDRPDVAAQYGVRFGPSGWELAWNTDGVAAGPHRIVFYAHHTTDGLWTVPRFRPVVVRSAREIWLPLMLQNR